MIQKYSLFFGKTIFLAEMNILVNMYQITTLYPEKYKVITADQYLVTV